MTTDMCKITFRKLCIVMLVASVFIGCSKNKNIIYYATGENAKRGVCLDKKLGWFDGYIKDDIIHLEGPVDQGKVILGPKSGNKWFQNSNLGQVLPIGYSTAYPNMVLIVSKLSKLMFGRHGVYIVENPTNENIAALGLLNVDLSDVVLDARAGAILKNCILVFDSGSYGDKPMRPSFVLYDMATKSIIKQIELPAGDAQPIRIVSDDDSAYWVGTGGTEIYKFSLSDSNIKCIHRGSHVGVAVVGDALRVIDSGCISKPLH